MCVRFLDPPVFTLSSLITPTPLSIYVSPLPLDLSTVHCLFQLFFYSGQWINRERKRTDSDHSLRKFGDRERLILRNLVTEEDRDVTEEDLETNEGEEVDLLTTFLDLSGWEVNDKEKEKELSSLLFDKICS